MKKIHFIIFMLGFIVKAFFDTIYVSKGINNAIDDIKYFFMMLGILF